MSNLGSAVGAWIEGMILLLFIFVPLGLWKAIEIVIWLCQHIRVTTV